MKTVYNLILGLHAESGKWKSVSEAIGGIIDYCGTLDYPTVPEMIDLLKDLKTIALLLLEDKHDEDDFWILYAKARDFAQKNNL